MKISPRFPPGMSVGTVACVAASCWFRAIAAPTPIPDLGVGANLNGYRPFPADNAWNRPINTLPVHEHSADYIASIGANKTLHPDFGADLDGVPFGIPYIVTDNSAPRVPIQFEYADESDPGPYPVPDQTPIEGGESSDGDRHMLVFNRQTQKLYELFAAHPVRRNGKLVRIRAESGAVFDLTSNRSRPAGWTSADAAGLPIFPGLVRYDEVASGTIRHAIRFTVSRSARAYIAPATHFASREKNPLLPPMGLRLRLRTNFDIAPFPPQAQVILRALKTYGLIVADNGSDWFVSGAPDSRFDDEQLSTLKRVKGRDFEAVQTGPLVTG